MFQVLVTRELPAGWRAPLDALLQSAELEVIGPPLGDVPYSHEELLERAPNVDAIVCLLTDRIDADIIAAGAVGRLRMIANVAVGFDNIDWRAAQAHGVMVTNTPGVLDETTADTTLLLMLGACRLASEAEADLRTGRWQGWGINQYLGIDVYGATLGIVGYGRIGQAVARRARGFNMNVLHHSRTDNGHDGYVAELDELLGRCDIISLHVPGGAETHHLIDARRLALMKPAAVLINTARGPVVDEAALAEALHGGRLFAAGIDVFEHEPVVHPRLLSAPRTVLLPHIGSGSQATRTNMAQLATRAVAIALQGGTPPNLIPRP